MKNKKFYISTAIAYTSSKPHIGNTYEIVMADAIARYKRLKGFDVYFQTGTDEHGQKIELKAKEKGLEPQEYVDEVASEVKHIWDIMNTSYNKFVRTTDKEHERIVQKIFKKLYDQGDIYKGKYEGWYCVPDEAFFTESQLVDGKCPDCGRDVKLTSEEAYFFRMSKYQEKLIDYINSHEGFIEPEARLNEMMNNFIKTGIQDLCVSRTSFKWGVPVDFDSNHVVYVWIDALTNYITFIGYDPDGSSDNFYKYWPADVQLIGKDILRFHTIYWPILLMALGEELPKKIFGHPWLLTGMEKMSKSRGNVMYADDLVNKYGVDPIRYYLLKEMPYLNDGSITDDLIIERINADLANTLGNLLNRTLSMVNKYFNGIVPKANNLSDIDKILINKALALPNLVDTKMDELKIGEAITSIMELLRDCNKYIDDTVPWTLAKNNDLERLATVLYNLLETIRICAVLLQPFIPDMSEKILNQLNTNIKNFDSLSNFDGIKNGDKVKIAEPLFQRIEKDV